MPRAPTAGITGELTRPGSYPGYLVQIDAHSATVRLTTLDRDFEYGGVTWTSADLEVTDLQFDGSVAAGATLQFGDQTIAFWVAGLYREFDDADVQLWFCYSDAPGEAYGPVPYRAGKAERKVGKDGELLSLALDAKASTLYAPRRRVQDVIDQKWLIQAGSIIIINGQKWVIDRPKTSNS